MARPRTERARKRRAFINALASGLSVKEACNHADICWGTAYAWRQSSASFAGAWDGAAECAQHALYERLEAALIQRAVEGVEEPVFHNGAHIGYRRRYSDTLLLAGLRQITDAYRESASQPFVLPPRNEEVAPRVALRTSGVSDDESDSKASAVAGPQTEPAPAPGPRDRPEPL